jgi:hypothetical protein
MEWDDLSPTPPGQQPEKQQPEKELKWDDLTPYKPSEAPSTLGSVARTVAREAVPTAAGILGMVGGGAGGAAAGTAVAPGVGTVAGGIAGGILGGAGAHTVAQKFQEGITDKLGLDSPESREMDARAHPNATLAAETATNLIGLRPAAAGTTIAQRLSTGAILGGIDVLGQGATKGFGNIDPKEVLAQGALGAVAPNVRPWASNAVERAAGKIGGGTWSKAVRDMHPSGTQEPTGQAEATPTADMTEAPPRAQPPTADSPEAIQAGEEGNPSGAGAGITPQTPAGNAGRPNFVHNDPVEAAAEKNRTQNIASPLGANVSPTVGTAGTPAGPVGGQRGQDWYGKGPSPYAEGGDNAPGQGLVRVENINQGPDVAAAMAEKPPLPGPDVNQGPAEQRNPSPLVPTPWKTPQTGQLPHSASDVTAKTQLEPIQKVTPQQDLGFKPRQPGMIRTPERLQAWRQKNPQEYPQMPGVGEAPAKQLAPSPEEAPPTKQFAPSEDRLAIPENLEIPKFLQRNPESFGQRNVPEQEPAAPQQPFGQRNAPEQVPEQSVPKMGTVQEATPEQDKLVAEAIKPQPQSLSAGAQQGPKDFRAAGAEAPAAEKTKFTSGFRDIGNKIAEYWGDNGWRRAISPQSLSEDTKSLDALFAQEQGRGVGRAARITKYLNDADEHLNSAPAEARQELLENNDVVGKDNVLGSYADKLGTVNRLYQKEMSKYDPNDRMFSPRLSNLFDPGTPEKGGPDFNRQIQDFIIDHRDNNSRPVTVGDIAKAGFKLRPELQRADGSPDIGKLNVNLNFMRDKFIEGQKVLRQAMDDGLISGAQRQGDVKLEDSGPQNMSLYASPDVAQVWNKFYDKGIRDPVYKNAYDAALHLKNVLNAVQLGFGAYHASAMTIEAMTHDVVTGIQRANVDPAGALKHLAGAPLAPFRLAKSGKRAIQAVTDPASVRDDPALRDTVSIAKDAGWTPVNTRGRGITPELDVSGGEGNSVMRNWWNAWPKAAEQMKIEMENAQKRVSDKYNQGITPATFQAAKEMFNAIGAGTRAAMSPLFQYYVPMLKAGAVIEQISQYKADNPGLSRKEYVDMARKFVKGTDDRFGELNQSTLYWNGAAKQAANLLMISPGWNVGTIRQIMGGVGAGIRNPRNTFATKNGQVNPDFDPRIAYSLGYGVVAAGVGGIYQFLKTGEMPQSPKDLFYPRTGGTAPRSNAPERAIAPGYQKDIQEWMHIATAPEGFSKAARQAAYNKLSMVPRAAFDTFDNADWAGHPIWNPNHSMGQIMGEYLNYVGKSLMPISVKQVTEAGPKSNIGPVESTLGLKPASAYIQKPEQSMQGARKANDKAWAEKERFDRRMKNQ